MEGFGLSDLRFSVNQGNKGAYSEDEQTMQTEPCLTASSRESKSISRT